MDLLPRPKVQAAITNRHGHLLAEKLPLEVCVAVVFPGSMMMVFFSLTSILSVIGREFLEPGHDVVVQTILKVVHIARCGDVHWVDQDQSIANAALSHNAFNFIRDADDFIPLGGLHMQFFDICGGLSGDQLSHAVR